MKKLPNEIYYIHGTRRDRPYAHKGHVKLSLNGRYFDRLEDIRIFKTVVTHGEDGWTDVTHEFIDENGELK